MSRPENIPEASHSQLRSSQRLCRSCSPKDRSTPLSGSLFLREHHTRAKRRRKCRRRFLPSPPSESASDMEDQVFSVLQGDLELPSSDGISNLAIREFRSSLESSLEKLSEVQTDVKAIREKEKVIEQNLTNLGTTVRKIIEPNADDLICVSCKEKRNCLVLPLTYFEESVMDANAVVPLVQLSCMLTVLSFAERFPEEQGIISSASRRLFEKEMNVISDCGASGFGMLAYAKKKNAKRNAEPSSLGLLWSLFLRESMMRAIIYAKDNLFECRTVSRNDHDSGMQHSSPTEPGAVQRKMKPAWLSAMDDTKAVRGTINAVAAKLEVCQTPSRSRSRSGSTQNPIISTGSPSASFASADGAPGAKRARLEVRRTARTQRRIPAAIGQDDCESAAWESGALGSSTVAPPRGREMSMQPADNEGEHTGVRLVLNKDVFLAEEYRLAAVRKLRFAWNGILNHTHTRMRELIYLDLMFLQEFIEQKFLSVAAKGPNRDVRKVREGYATARESNYEYLFNGNAAEELNIPPVCPGPVWPIPTSFCGDEYQAREVASGVVLGPTSNLKLLEDLKKAYPCLKIDMRYKVSIFRTPGDLASTSRQAASSSQPNFFVHKEEVYLHDLAKRLIIDRFKVKEDCSLLAISALSIRAIHIIAIALRALLRERLGFDLLPVEKAALGDVRHRDVSATESTSTTKIEDSSSKTGDGTTKQSATRAKNLNKKMVITYSEWLKRNLPPPLSESPARGSLRDSTRSTQEASASETAEDGTARDAMSGWAMGK